MSMQAFAEAVTPLVETLKAVDVSKPREARASLAASLPLDAALLQSIRAAAEAGMNEGWLLTKEVGGIRFGRVAKDLKGFSVDAVLLDCAGPPHRHPKGEIDLCFALNDGAAFDGNPEGWVVYPPDSKHTPTVTGGAMLILYFLPGGAFEMLV